MNNEIQNPEELLDNSLRDVINLIKTNKFDKAREILNNYLSYSIPMTEETENEKYFSFRDSLEFYSAVRILNLNKKAIWTKFKNSYVYNLLSYIANEEKEYTKAIEYSKCALSFNPLDSNLYFELAETYKFLKDFESMKKITLDAYKVLFDSKELARFYRNLGFYYTEKEMYDTAFALYVVSLNFDVDETAYHEIDFIRNKLSNEKYSLNKEEVINLLKQENIDFGISTLNKKILFEFINNQEVNKKDFNAISQAKSMYKKSMINMEEVDYLLSIRIMPKIDSSDMFDEEKSRLTLLDEEIQKKNIEIIKAANLSIPEKIKGIPIDSATNLKTSEEILREMLSVYTIATISVYALEGKNELISVVLNTLDQKLGITKSLTPQDNMFIKMLFSGNVSKLKLQSLTWLYEKVYVYMWALGLLPKPNVLKECDTEKIDEFLIGINGYDDLVSKIKPLDKKKILEYADLINRYNFAVIDAGLKNKTLEGINIGVIKEQKSALDFILEFRIENLMKDYITLNYKKNNFDFSMEIPSFIHIKEVVNIKKPRNMLSLVNDNESMVITLVNYGTCAKEDFESKYLNDINDYISFGWTKVYEKDYMRGEQEIKQIFLNVILPEKNTVEFGIVKYYFLLNGNMVSIESLLEQNLDYKSNLDDSVNNKVAFDMVISVKEK